jgi:hypothetical protein
MDLVLNGKMGGCRGLGVGSGGAQASREGAAGGVREGKAFHEVMAHLKEIPLCFLSPIPIRR